MSYGYGLPDAYRQSARLVIRILKGDRPGDLPFQRPARHELIVDLKTAKAVRGHAPGFVRAARRRGDRVICGVLDLCSGCDLSSRSCDFRIIIRIQLS